MKHGVIKLPTNAWDGKGNLKKSIEKNENVYISLGGWSGSIPLLKTMNGTSEQQRKALNDFTFKFLPAALPKDEYNEKQWGVFPPYNPNASNSSTEMVKGFDIDLEPYANDWTQISCDEVIIMLAI